MLRIPTIESAFKYHQSGNLVEAEKLYRQILTAQPDHVDANHLLGVLAHQLGNHEVAIAYISKAIKLNPRNPDFYSNLGEAYRMSGNFGAAIAQYQTALNLQPHNGKTYYNLGNALQALGNKDRAIAQYRKAIELLPNLAQAHHNLGFLLFAKDRNTDKNSEAIAAYERAIAINPHYVQALTNLGIALQASGRVLEAIDIYQKALGIAPNSAEIYNELGNALQANYDFDRAIAQYQKAILLKADFAEAYYNLGNAYTIRARTEEAESAYRQAILIKHDRAEWYVTLGTLLKDANRMEEAIALFQTALAYNPHLIEAQFKISLALPIFYETSEQIYQWRERFSLGLDTLSASIRLDTPEQIKQALQAIHNFPNFYLPYQAHDDLVLQTKYGELVHRIMKAAYPQYSQPLAQIRSNLGRIRLGFISSYFRNHTVGKLFLGWLQNINRDRFEIYCYFTGKLPTSATAPFAQSSDFFYHLPHLDPVISQIARDRLDILVFTDIGMNPETTQVAALRLAPVQCMAWGHPITSGLPTMDYFISSDLMEPIGAEAYYREQLIHLPNLSIHYPRPETPQHLCPRSQFQIPEDAVVYLCCQSLFKYLPQYDYIFAAIAAKVPKAKFVFITSNNGDRVTQQFQQRLQQAFARLNSSTEYCLIMPRLERDQYLSLNLISDIFLDTIDWSGGNTTLEAIACNLPVVTLPKQFMRSRHSYAMLGILETTETIAQTESEYIDIAIKLGLDRSWRSQIVKKMQAHSDRLYSDSTCLQALEKFLSNPTEYTANRIKERDASGK